MNSLGISWVFKVASILRKDSEKSTGPSLK